MPELAVGDIVQIAPNAQVNRVLQGQLAYVIEMKAWGIKVGVPMPGGSASQHAHTGLVGRAVVGIEGTEMVAYTRVAHGYFERIGQPEWVPEWVLE